MAHPRFKDPFDLASTDALINRVRGRQGLRTLDADDRRAFSAGWSAAYADMDDCVASERERVAEAAGRAFRAANPALTRWRDRVLKHPRRFAKADVAAAYECLALESKLAGDAQLAMKWSASARRVMGVAPIAQNQPSERISA